MKMSAQLRCLKQANNNANDGVSVVNTADGAMTEMHEILQRMNELAIQAANGTNADSDREQIQLEIDQLVQFTPLMVGIQIRTARKVASLILMKIPLKTLMPILNRMQMVK